MTRVHRMVGWYGQRKRTALLLAVTGLVLIAQACSPMPEGHGGGW